MEQEKRKKLLALIDEGEMFLAEYEAVKSTIADAEHISEETRAVLLKIEDQMNSSNAAIVDILKSEHPEKQSDELQTI